LTGGALTLTHYAKLAFTSLTRQSFVPSSLLHTQTMEVNTIVHRVEKSLEEYIEYLTKS